MATSGRTMLRTTLIMNEIQRFSVRLNLLNEDDLKKILGLSDRQARQLMRKEDFPSFNIGYKYYVKAENLDAYLAVGSNTRLDYGNKRSGGADGKN